MPISKPGLITAPRYRCGARTRGAGSCLNWALSGKRRCRMHGGASSGAKSFDGKQRQAEGRERYLSKLRGQGRKPGPAKGTGGRPPKSAFVNAVEGLRRSAVATLSHPRLDRRSTAMSADPDEQLRGFIDQVLINVPAAQSPSKPTLAADNPAAVPAFASSCPNLSLVPDASELAVEVEEIGRLATTRIKEILRDPFDEKNPNYVALLKFVSSVYGSTMNTILRADENRLRHRTVDRLPELLRRVAEEERKRAARTIEGSFDDAS
jgi:hypothetical protein